MNENSTNLCVFVNSFDGYKDLWSTFFLLYDRYWDDCDDFKIYLSSNFEEFNHKNLTVLKTGKEICWIKRTLQALRLIKEKYIVFMLEDYYCSKKINKQDIIDIINFMQENDISYYRLVDTPRSVDINDTKLYIGGIPKNQRYGINLFPAIWDKEYLLELLNDLYKNDKIKTAWEFETKLVEKAELSSSKLYKNMCVDRRDLMGFKVGVLKGKWIRGTLIFYKRQGINIETKGRKKLSIIDTLIYNIKIYINNHFSENTKLYLKKIAKKIGFKFLTE